MYNKINDKIKDLDFDNNRLQYDLNIADKLGFTSEISFINSILKERIDFRNFLLELIRSGEKNDI